MKKIIITSILAALFASGTLLRAQDMHDDYLGLPGDNLNLYAVMNLFRESKTLEEFERNLNDEKTNINNLDLNNDNLIDYIKVIDNIDGDVHNIVLQVAVSPRENQDVAVFTVQRFNNGQVFIQLTGDEELYGKDYIVEPITDAAETPNPGYTGPAITYVRTTPAQIAVWPVVSFIYMPDYRVWHSSWYWGYYPNYWHPWRPFSWHFYYGYHYPRYHDYYANYRIWHTHRDSHWHDYYYVGKRSYSPEVNHYIHEGTYKTTYSHPDQRHDGEVLFAKNHPDQYRRYSDRSSGNSNPTNRRTNTTVIEKSGNHPGNNSRTIDRSNPNSNTRTIDRSKPDNNTRTIDRSNPNNHRSTERSNTTVTRRSVNTTPVSTERSSVTTRRTVTETNSGRNNNASKQSKSSVSNSNSARRSNSAYKQQNTSKKENKKSDDNTKSSERRR